MVPAYSSVQWQALVLELVIHVTNTQLGCIMMTIQTRRIHYHKLVTIYSVYNKWKSGG